MIKKHYETFVLLINGGALALSWIDMLEQGLRLSVLIISLIIGLRTLLKNKKEKSNERQDH